MFLFAITKEGIAQNFKSVKVEEVLVHSYKVTIITDDFLSDFIPESDGFSVIESPLIFTPNFRDIIFSQVTYNNKKDTLSIFKSTISGRPIYYHINSKGEFFCSTHISLLRSAGVPIEENIAVLPEFFVYRHIMSPNTLYKNIYQLLSGGCLQIKITDSKCAVQSIDYYAPPHENQNSKSLKDGSIKLYEFLSESIKKLDICKDEIAILLSGGIDSSVMYKICQNKFSIDASYSTGYPFEDPAMNVEKEYALSAAQALGTTHQYYEPTIDEYLIGFLESIKHAEEPLHHLQSILLHLLMKNGIRNDERIIIHGQGAGTLFGSNHLLYLHNKTLIQKLSAIPTAGVFETLSRISTKAKAFLDIINIFNPNYYLSNTKNSIWSWMDYGSKEWVCSYFNLTENDIIENRYNFIKKFQNLSIYDIWSLYSFFSDEQSTLSIWTKIGEENKKILYSPFYDETVLNYVFSIPWKLKLQHPENSLRKEIANLANIPKFIINRPKSSFGIRPEDWGKKGNIFEPLVPLASKVFDENEIRKMQSSEPKKAMTYWNMLNYAIWKRLFIDNEPLAVLLEELNELI